MKLSLYAQLVEISKERDKSFAHRLKSESIEWSIAIPIIGLLLYLIDFVKFNLTILLIAQLVMGIVFFASSYYIKNFYKEE